MMKKIIHLFFPVIMLSLFSCHDTEAKHEMEEPDFDGFVKISLQSQITGVQPMTGIVLWADNAKRNTDAISLEYSYMQYKDIVKEKGVYDWTPLEQILDAVASRKHQAIIRFWYTYPGYESAVPQYIRELPDYEETVALSEGKRTGFPDWRHPELQRFHKEFYQKFAERYDNDPRLAFLQTGFGLWAEYHIYDGPRIMGQTFPSKEFQAEFFRFMSETFKSTPWSVSIDAASSEYTPLEADASLRNLKFGVFDDSFMHETHDEYNGKNWKILGEKRYQTSPAGGEFGYYTKYDQEHVLDYPDGIHGRNFEGESKRFHITYMIGNNQPSYQTMNRIKQASMLCGYRYEITDVRVKEDSTCVQIKNAGVAPIYYDAYVAVNEVRSESNLKDLQPGQSRWVGIPAGSTDMEITIECDRLVSGQKIEFDADVKGE